MREKIVVSGIITIIEQIESTGMCAKIQPREYASYIDLMWEDLAARKYLRSQYQIHKEGQNARVGQDPHSKGI